MAEQSRHRMAASFGAAAAEYERGRPGYPEAALDWLLPEGATTVLDLGAGTGKLTRQLVARGLETYAVEPSPEMLGQLRTAVPQARPLPGRAEEIPLPDGSVDAVLVAQAWHWVDPSHAGPEVARVLRPGGTLGLVWNFRDDRVPWVAELSALLAGPDTDADHTVLDPRRFTPVERTRIDWTHELSREELLDLVASRSYVITAPPAARDALLERVRDLVSRHPGLAGTDRVRLPYRTTALKAVTRR